MVIMTRKAAEKEAFGLVPETCPHVDEALSVAASAIKDQTGALREALIDALDRAIDAEDRVSDLEDEIRELKLELEDARSEASA
jgi:hypothetical protein